MNIEDQIKQTVEEKVSSRPSVSGAWERVQHRFRRQQRIRMTAAIAGAAAAIAAVAVIVPNLGTDRRIVPIETPAPSESISTTPTPTPEGPTEIVAMDHDAEANNTRIVVLSAKTGEVIRVLLAESTTGNDATAAGLSGDLGLALSADGKTVYFVRGSGDCTRSIHSIPIEGGKETEVARGYAPALSPDGRYLAYSGVGDEQCNHEPLVVRDLASGEERRWKWKAKHRDNVYESGGAFDLSWAPDSRHLAFMRSVSDPLFEIWVLDTTAGDDFLDAVKVTPEETEFDHVGWTQPAFLDAGRLVTAHTVRWDHPDGPLHVLEIFDPTVAEGESTTLFDPKGEVLEFSADPETGVIVFSANKGIFRLEDGKATLIAEGNYRGLVW